MAITTADGVVAGMQFPRSFAKALSGTLVAGRPYSYWATAGLPGAGSYDSTLAGVALSSTSSQVAGQLHYTDPTGGTFSYVARLSATCTQAAVLILADRLWHNGGITITQNTAQTVNSATLPARDNAGSTNGDGVLAALEVSAGTGAGTPTLTLSYTNQAGTASRTATNVISTVASSAAGSVYLFGLQAGDTGIRSIQTYTQSATWTSGTVNLVLYRPLIYLELPGALVPNAVDFITSGGVRMFDGSVPYLMIVPNTTTSSQIIGNVVYTHG